MADAVPVYTKEALTARLQAIAEMGWVPNIRHGNHGGIGNTLEQLLGIKENNLPIPNAAEWELKAARTCRVSSSSTAKPAFCIPAYSHCESGPASSPIRVSVSPKWLNQSISASGSLATLASRMIRPVVSTTHRLELSNDTSIPA